MPKHQLHFKVSVYSSDHTKASKEEFDSVVTELLTEIEKHLNYESPFKWEFRLHSNHGLLKLSSMKSIKPEDFNPKDYL